MIFKTECDIIARKTEVKKTYKCLAVKVQCSDKMRV